MIFDTHAHYDDEDFDGDRQALLEGLSGAGVRAVTNIGASLSSSRATLELAARYPWMYAAIGVHPSDTGELSEDGIGRLREAAAGEKLSLIHILRQVYPHHGRGPRGSGAEDFQAPV